MPDQKELESQIGPVLFPGIVGCSTLLNDRRGALPKSLNSVAPPAAHK